jgi:hypothetical protein
MRTTRGVWLLAIRALVCMRMCACVLTVRLFVSQDLVSVSPSAGVSWISDALSAAEARTIDGNASVAETLIPSTVGAQFVTLQVRNSLLSCSCTVSSSTGYVDAATLFSCRVPLTRGHCRMCLRTGMLTFCWA